MTDPACFCCGQSRPLDGRGACASCAEELEARVKPRWLQDLEHVANGFEPETQMQRSFKQLLDKDPKSFIVQLRGAQKEWQEMHLALGPAHGRAGSETDSSADDLIKTLEEAIAQAEAESRPEWERENETLRRQVDDLTKMVRSLQEQGKAASELAQPGPLSQPSPENPSPEPALPAIAPPAGA